MRWLGRIYGGREGYPANQGVALLYYLLGAEFGDADSQLSLGLACLERRLRPDDLETGFAWCRAAARQGHMLAAGVVGMAYREGIGTRKNARLARYWLQRSAAAGNELARQALEKMSTATTSASGRSGDE
jgi:TPR repeat protein